MVADQKSSHSAKGEQFIDMTTIEDSGISVSEFIEPRFDGGPGARARIGVIALVHDLGFEPEFSRFSQCEGVAVYANRIDMDHDTTPATLRDMLPRIEAATRGLAHLGALDVVAYGCTAGSLMIGPDRIEEAVARVLPSAHVVTPISSVVAALRAASCRRIGLITPYSEELNKEFAGFLESRDFEIVCFRSFQMRDGFDMGRIDPACLLTAAGPMADADMDGLFISCTALNVSPVLGRLEELVGKPVITSNQAMAWHALRLAGIEDEIANLGRYLSVLTLLPEPAKAAE